MKRLLMVGLVAGALMVPQKSEAQTWCLGAGPGAACLTVSSFEFLGAIGGDFQARLTGTWSNISPLSTFTWGLSGGGSIWGTPILFTVFRSTVVSPDTPFTADMLYTSSRVRVDRLSTLDDLSYIGIDGVGSCSPSNGTCFPLVSNVVPEPSTYALLATGLVGVAIVARRRQQLEAEEA